VQSFGQGFTIPFQQFKDDEESQKFLNDHTIKEKLANAKPLIDVKASE